MGRGEGARNHTKMCELQRRRRQSPLLISQVATFLLVVRRADITAAQQYENCTGNVESIGDYVCDDINNNAPCSFDGGDCCPSTCGSDDSSTFPCYIDPRKCFDPAAIDYDPTYENCTGDFWSLGDARCDEDLNNAACLFDGGDCCACTCVDDFALDPCGTEAPFSCIDPDAADINFDCQSRPAEAVSPCTPVFQRDWVVQDTVDADALVDALSLCSDGVFEVEWNGYVSVNRTIRVADRTSLTVNGASGSSSSSSAGSAGVVDGMGKIRPFSVVNATLTLNSLEIRNGVAPANNSNGGALFIAAEAAVTLAGATTFVNNSAAYGGAISVGDGSILSWDNSRNDGTATVRFANNSASPYGGALYISDDSIASWSGVTTFIGNYADDEGGAVFVTGRSSLYSSPSTTAGGGGGGSGEGGLTSFVSNSAFGRGGALMAWDNSTVSFGGENTTFVGNIAKYGAAVYSKSGSNVSFSGVGETLFAQNHAKTVIASEFLTEDDDGDAGYSAWGGALFVESAHASWGNGGGITTFRENTAIQTGGAVRVERGTLLCLGPTRFIGNSVADGQGGAVYVHEGSAVSWSGSDVLFFENTADVGGAVYLTDAVNVSWGEGGGVTTFELNRANSNGGAVGCSVGDPQKPTSMVNIDGETNFVGNSCGSYGGALALTSAVRMELGPESREVFSGNLAGAGGGAVFLSAAAYGPAFVGANFTFNSAAVGGAVYSTASGTAVIEQTPSEEVEVPTTYERCNFEGNSAASVGGAIETAAGRDVVWNSTFRSNWAAGAGGAVRLAGTATMVGCSFSSNVAGEGPAVSNIGSTTLKDCEFVGNTVECDSKTFVDYFQGDRYGKVCLDCPECEGDCNVEDDQLVPGCTEAYDHSESVGSNVTLETLKVAPGYWRATNTSRTVLPCYNPDACLGGTSGAEGYCLEGYEGPYCSVCSDGYAMALAFSCVDCSHYNVLLTVVLVGAVALIGSIAAVVHLISKVTAGDSKNDTPTTSTSSGGGGGSRGGRGGRGRFASFRRERLWLQPVKTVIVVWQIMTQFTSVTSVTYPRVYQRFLDGVELLSFDLGSIVPVGCFFDFDFHDHLLTSTIAPILVVGVLGITYTIAKWRNSDSVDSTNSTPSAGAEETPLQIVKHRHVSALLLVLFLVYSSVSSVIFSTFACDSLEDEKSYLRADYRVECTSDEHTIMKIYAAVMILVYPVGIPVFFAALLFANRRVLAGKTNDRFSFRSRDDDPRVRPISDLWKPYKAERYYYEVIECGRRVCLTGVVVFIFPNTAAQIAITLILAFGFNIIAEGLAPYASRWDAWISRAGHAVVFVSMYVALLLKVDVSEESSQSQEVFAGVIVAAHACLILAAIVEMITVGLAFIREQAEDRVPRATATPHRGTSSGGGSKAACGMLEDSVVVPPWSDDGLDDRGRLV